MGRDALVRALVAEVPEGRATTYGLVAEAVERRTGRRCPALAVGRVLAGSGGNLPWWRVVRAAGDIDERLAPEAHALWRSEGLPVRTSRGGIPRIDLHACLWDAPEESALAGAGVGPARNGRDEDRTDADDDEEGRGHA